MKKSKTLKLLISMIFLFSIVFNATTLSASVKKFTLKVGEKKTTCCVWNKRKESKMEIFKEKIATVNKKGIVKGKKRVKQQLLQNMVVSKQNLKSLLKKLIIINLPQRVHIQQQIIH